MNWGGRTQRLGPSAAGRAGKRQQLLKLLGKFPRCERKAPRRPFEWRCLDCPQASVSSSRQRLIMVSPSQIRRPRRESGHALGGLRADPSFPLSQELCRGWGFSTWPPSPAHQVPCLTPGPGAQTPCCSRARVPEPRGVPTPPSHRDIKGKQEAASRLTPSRRGKCSVTAQPGAQLLGIFHPTRISAGHPDSGL